MSYKTYAINNKTTQLLAPAARGTTSTSWVAPFSDGVANRAVFELNVGTVGGNVTWKLTQATDSSGTGAKDIPNAVGVTITTSNDPCVQFIELNSGSLDLKNGFTYVRAEVTVATGTPPWGVNLIQHQLRHKPVEQDTTVTAIVDVSN